MKNYLLNCGGKLLSLEKPVVMGVINITDNSFYEGSRYVSPSSVKQQINKMIDEGASIIDIGASSSKPGSKPVDVHTELKQVLMALEIIKLSNDSIPVSIDTTHAVIAEAALQNGAHIINDVSGGNTEMYEVVKKYNATYVLMHIQGLPETMQHNPQYDDVVAEVMDYFSQKLNLLKSYNVDVILDVGFGFGKTVAHNYSLLKALPCFSIFDKPLLAGVSRKSMITRVLKLAAKDALHGTAVLHTFALMQGASILRAHDVAEANQCIKLYNQFILAD